jgi:DNA-binding response OmpR family regulator
MTSTNRLLLIDDEPGNLELLIITLEDYGFDILTELEGCEGLASAQRHQPDLILLDIQMPRMDGFTVCQALKADPQTAAIPVIFLTSQGREADRVKGFELGAVDFLTKPVFPQELYARITLHLNQQRLQHNLEQRLVAYQKRFGALDNQQETPDEQTQRHLQQVKMASDLLLKDLRNPPKLEELAHSVGSNPHKLSKDFQILYGMTVFEWLREQRMQEAAKLLHHSDYSIQHIADMLGYTLNSNFATAFKKRFNLSPREYRKLSE